LIRFQKNIVYEVIGINCNVLKLNIAKIYN